MTAVRWGMPAPSHWPRTRVKYACRFVGGGTPDKGNIEYWNGEIPWVEAYPIVKTIRDEN
jgi:type I restriction enzyme, S subunit